MRFYPGRCEVIEVGRDFERMQDFIVGRLSDDEHRAFEDRLARDPALVHELEQSLRLSEGLHQLRVQGYFDKAASRARGSRTWLPLLAAAAIAGLALFLWLQPNTRTLPLLEPSLHWPPPARRKASRSIPATEELDQRRDARSGLVGPPGRSPPKPAFDLNRQNPGNSPESLQLVGLHRTRQYPDPRERRAVAKAKRATSSGALVHPTPCARRDPPREID